MSLSNLAYKLAHNIYEPNTYTPFDFDWNLAGQLKAISTNSDSVELTCLLDNNLTDIQDQVSSHTQQQLAAAAESSSKTVDFHGMENVVAAADMIVARSWAQALNFAPTLVGHIVAWTCAPSWAAVTVMVAENQD
eukprot:scaffold42113_cov46-Attheya_sp.AAC.1